LFLKQAVPAGQIAFTTLLHFAYAGKIIGPGAGVGPTAGHVHPIHIQKMSFQQIEKFIYYYPVDNH
jgi:hypothetical protein